jgi:hypothetical protein
MKIKKNLFGDNLIEYIQKRGKDLSSDKDSPLSLTTKKGCFNCGNIKCREDMENSGVNIDEIVETPEGIKFKTGCCCQSYRGKRFVFR